VEKRVRKTESFCRRDQNIKGSYGEGWEKTPTKGPGGQGPILGFEGRLRRPYFFLVAEKVVAAEKNKSGLY